MKLRVMDQGTRAFARAGEMLSRIELEKVRRDGCIGVRATIPTNRQRSRRRDAGMSMHQETQAVVCPSVPADGT